MAEAKSQHDEAMALLHAGYEALESLELDAAAERGAQVAARGEVAGYELIAAARMRQARGDEAVQAMEQAESSEPSSWGILNRLGSICSDLGRYERAEEAFRRALGLSGADENAIRINLAILCWRMGRFDEAISWCDSVAASAWRLAAREVRVGVLASAGRWDEAITATEGIVEEIQAAEQLGTNRESFARLCSLRGRALWSASGDQEGAIACVRIALALSPTCPEALDVLREARAQRSTHARQFHIIVRGLWHEPLEPGGRIPGFLRTYHVIADDPQEAIGYAIDIEPIPLAMQADKVRDDGAAEPGYKGVTSCSGYMFQPA